VTRFLSVLVLASLFFCLGFWSHDVFAEQPNNPARLAPGDQEMSPSQLHQMLADMKQERLNRMREVGKIIPLEGTLAQSYYDAKYYRLDVNLDDTTEIISGSVYVYGEALIDGFNVLELNFFDNPEMYVDSIMANGATASFIWNNNIIRIYLNGTYYSGENFAATVYYHGHPLEGGLQSFDWGYHGSPAMPIICTLSEPYFAQSWWPCKDLPRDKADSVDIKVRVRSDICVSSNGLLREVLGYGSTKTYKWHESYPITTYLVSIAATDYTIFSNWYHPVSKQDSMEVVYSVYPECYDQAVALWPVTPSIIECYANAFGEYPFLEEKYGMSHFTWGGAMEHQTNTSFSSYWYSESVIAHELAHQWWGDYITCHNWHHIWLNEGFASWSEALWAEHLGGASSYHSYMNGMEYTGGGSIFVEDTTDAWNIFDRIVYDKGAWVLHMLRGVVGDEDFFQILRNYYSDPRYAYGAAETEDFQEICETTTGMDLDYFFQEWIYGEYYPKYEYSYTWEPSGLFFSMVYVHLEQTQTTDPTHFTMPVEINVSTYSMDTTVVLFNDPRHKDFGVRLLGTSGFDVDVDPDRWILRSTSSTSYGMNIVTTDVPSVQLGVAYAETLLVKGGTAPYVWKLKSGSLPDGLGLDSLTGVIFGVPTAQDSFHFNVKVTDSSVPNKTDAQKLYILVTEGYIRGDANHDLVVDVGDVVYIVNYLYRGGPEPLPLESADVNCDGVVNVGDVVYLINYLFRGGPPPC
jgi:aminopeptidase N